ncbi:MAG: hypothetical protein ABI297_01050 [Ginsengibacter sp.]
MNIEPAIVAIGSDSTGEFRLAKISYTAIKNKRIKNKIESLQYELKAVRIFFGYS